MSARPKARFEWAALGKLRPNPGNPREIGEEEFARLKHGIERFGIVDPIVARARDGLVLGGHRCDVTRQRYADLVGDATLSPTGRLSALAERGGQEASSPRPAARRRKGAV